jgi:mannose-6-phosphate isomerase-like protein (cupin superfamily)
MRRLLLGCAVLAASATMFAQAQPGTTAQGRQTAPAPKPTTPATQAPPARPATPQTAPAPRPAPARRPAATARGGVTVVVTSMTGMPLGDVRVLASGPTDRSGTTDGQGRLSITGMQAGTYRLRFVNEDYVEFEREITVRGGPNMEIDVALRPAPPPRVVTVAAPAPPPPPAPVATVGPVGQFQAATIVTLLDRELIKGNEPRKEAVLSCSGNTRTTLVQMNQDQAVRLYESADVSYYVVAGEGTVKAGTRDVPIEATSFVSVPRGTSFSVARRGRRPLIMVMQLSGEPCEQAR